MQPDESNERRRYFRIEDEVILFCRVIRPEEVPGERTLNGYESDSFSLPAKLEMLTRESRPHLRRIEREYPEVGGFLRTLEQKIDLIAHAVISSESELLEQPTRKVTLSASGLAFVSEGEFDLGSTLELKMVLPPALVGLIAYGRVVSCQSTGFGDGGYYVAVDFMGLREMERELLVRHIVKRQMQQLRERKQASEQ